VKRKRGKWLSLSKAIAIPPTWIYDHRVKPKGINIIRGLVKGIIGLRKAGVRGS
jgi:hypothetical protein